MYAVRPIFKILLLIIPAICGLLFALNILRRKRPLQLKEGLRRCVKALPIVIPLSILGGVCCLLYLVGAEPYSESFKMGYTYPQASKGLTPNGTTLDVSEIFSDEVLESAIQIGYLGNLTVDEIRNTLSINNVKSRSNVSVDDLYVSTEYRISYNASAKTAAMDKDLLIKAVADAYYDYFISKYGRKTDILESDFSEICNLDYLDINSYMYERAETVIDYMEMCRRENSSFVSEVTNESFASIRDRAKNFRDVSLDRNKAYILKDGISKDREQYISRLNYGNRITNVEYMKNLAAYRVRLSAIERYEGDITKAVLVPTRDKNGEFYQSRTKIGTDYFANEADEHLKDATSNQLSIETNNYYIESLSSAKNNIESTEKAEAMVESLRQEIAEISHLAAETVKDYDAQTSNGYISFSVQDEGDFKRSCMKKTVLYVVALSGLMFAAVFTGGRLRPEKKRNYHEKSRTVISGRKL